MNFARPLVLESSKMRIFAHIETNVDSIVWDFVLILSEISMLDTKDTYCLPSSAASLSKLILIITITSIANVSFSETLSDIVVSYVNAKKLTRR